MKQLKDFLCETATIWAFIIFVGFFFGLPLLRDLKLEALQSNWFYTRTLAVFVLLAVAFWFFCQLRYWVIWILVLIVLAIFSTGIDLPHRFVLYPDKHSIVGVLLSFIAIFSFWFLEKLESKYIGLSSSAEQTEPFSDEDKIVTLNLDDNIEALNTKSIEDRNL
jgi:uncharacterized membrane protein YoaK (UPF0700 family)